MLFQILFLIFLHVLLAAELKPAVVYLVAAGQFVAPVGRAPDDVAFVVRAEHGQARHDPDVNAGLVLAIMLASELQRHFGVRGIDRAGVHMRKWRCSSLASIM